MIDWHDGMTRIYFVTGDDHLDDPAWGIEPVFTGDDGAATAWLTRQSDLTSYSVLQGMDFIQGADFLARQGIFRLPRGRRG